MEYKHLWLAIILTTILSGCSKVQVSDSQSKVLPLDANGTTNPQGTSDGTVHNTAVQLKADMKQVDLQLVIDNSLSMKPDSLALGSKLEGFIQKLESYSLDWQLCLMTTDYDGENGKSLAISGVSRSDNWILKKGDTDISNKILSTLDNMVFGAKGTGDERAIASLSAHLSQSSTNHCYRPDSALSVVLISDEDERSVGGNSSLDSSNQAMPIENIDLPEKYVDQVQSQLGAAGAAVPLAVHSIIVKPGDQSCLDEQYNQGYPGYAGTFYNKLSELTGGSVGSICSTDFSQGLNVFADQIQKSLQRVKLDCARASLIKVSFEPAVSNAQTHLENNFLVIDTRLAQDESVSVQYTCP